MGMAQISPFYGKFSFIVHCPQFFSFPRECFFDKGDPPNFFSVMGGRRGGGGGRLGAHYFQKKILYFFFGGDTTGQEGSLDTSII